MSFLLKNRASVILYNFIRTYNDGIYLLPANVCPIVPLVFSLANVEFEFVDINDTTLCIDEQIVLDKVSQDKLKYRGILFVRTYGYIYDTTPFFRELSYLNKELKIIDDRCLCFPDISQKEEINCDLVLYSTGHGKSVDFGIGGFGILSEQNKINNYDLKYNKKIDIEKIYKEALDKNEKLKFIPKGWLDTSSYNIAIDEYFYKIEVELQKVKIHKERLNGIYRDLLPKTIVFPSEFQNWRFNICVKNKQLILNEIFYSKLFASSHYKASNILFNDMQYINTNKLFGNIINLFNDFYFTEEQAEMVCAIVNNCIDVD